MSDSSAAPEPANSVPNATAAERLAVLALALATFGMALNSNVLAALQPFLIEELGFDKTQFGELLAAAGWAGAAGALVLGPIVDRVGRRPPLLWGTVLFCVGSAGYLIASSFRELMAVRALTGFAAGVVFTSASAAVADLVPYTRRAAAMGVLTAAIFLAIPIGMPLAVELSKVGPQWWRGIFVVQAATAILALAFMAKALPAGIGRGGTAPSPWRVLRQPMVTPALLSVLLYTGAFFTTVQFLGTWLHETDVLPRADQSWMWVTLGLGSAVGSAVLGRLADQIGKRNFVLWTTMLVAVALLLLARVASLEGLIAVGVPIALLSASRSAALLALISGLVEPRLRGTLLGVRAAAVNLGMGAFSGLGGRLYESQGYRALLMAAAITMALAYLCVRLFVHERRVES